MAAWFERGQVVRDPEIVELLTRDTRAGWLWLPLRLWLGWQWLEAGRAKLADPSWSQTGEGLRTFWQQAVAVPPAGRPPIAFDWYRSLIESLLASRSETWFAPFVAWTEVLIGALLVLGAFTGIAAFLGATMNWNLMMAGEASANPVLLAIAVGLILAWKVAGYVGMDAVLLPTIGTPWSRPRRRAPGERERPQRARVVDV